MQLANTVLMASFTFVLQKHRRIEPVYDGLMVSYNQKGTVCQDTYVKQFFAIEENTSEALLRF